MNCANHPDLPAVAFCRNCGKPLCVNCQRMAQGTVFCDEHAPGTPFGSPYATPPGASPYAQAADPYSGHSRVSPGLAFVLGWIPGVGAIYNGQYAKGLIHAVILGLIISIQSSGASAGLEPLFGLLAALWVFYMAFEAYHTAQKRQRGEPVDEFSSVFPMGPRVGRGFPVGPVLLIIIGVIFLLNTLELVRLYEILRYWPVFLIALGAYMLYARLTDRADTVRVEPTGVAPEVSRES